MNLSTVKWAQWDKTQSREMLVLFMCVCVCVCSAVHCVHLLHTVLHRTDLIIFPLAHQTITIAPMMSIWGKGGRMQYIVQHMSERMVCLSFRISPGSAGALVRWVGKVKLHLIAYFLGNICAKNYQNRFMYDRVIARESSNIFETQCSFDYACDATVANKRWTSDFVHSVWPLVS